MCKDDGKDQHTPTTPPLGLHWNIIDSAELKTTFVEHWCNAI